MSLCSFVKRELATELKQAVQRTLDNGHEFGFPVCDTGRLIAGEMVEGNSRAVVIPSCKVGRAAGMVHSHRSSPAELEAKFGSALMSRYFGHPSAQDIRPAVGLKFGCVISRKMLVCYKKPERNKSEIEQLAKKEDAANGAFALWTQGHINDQQFRQVIQDTVHAQEAAMRATSSRGFCRVRL